eukprot:8245940-Prorocentrum_lima.AAC.1
MADALPGFDAPPECGGLASRSSRLGASMWIVRRARPYVYVERSRECQALRRLVVYWKKFVIRQ